MKQNNIDLLTDVFPDAISDDFKAEFFEGMVSMAYHLNIDGRKLAEQLAYEYMKYIYENISTSNAFIRSHTGYKRTTVENFKLKYEKTRLTQPKKTNKYI
ncbi:hypothetical protein MNBD_GAMMA02-1624 [hydrothermal vent metagenome]|uniref:Uncharacterized protein n=1 Tax=hydrothermal vent metagenome TaxID=652676 RepID=A0A3B0W7P1_9ZZZZ